MKCCKLPQWYGAQPQPLTILVHFEAVETLLMTSKMCIVLCTWFVLPCHSFLNSAHIIFVYFVLQKITSPPFSASFCPGAYAPLPPIPASTVCNEHNGAFSFVDNTVYSHRHRLGNNIWADLCPLSTFLPVFFTLFLSYRALICKLLLHFHAICWDFLFTVSTKEVAISMNRHLNFTQYNNSATNYNKIKLPWISSQLWLLPS